MLEICFGSWFGDFEKMPWYCNVSTSAEKEEDLSLGLEEVFSLLLPLVLLSVALVGDLEDVLPEDS